MKNILFFYDPNLLLPTEDGEEGPETTKSVKEHANTLRRQFPGSGVMIRDAAVFSEIEARTVGVVYLGDADGEELARVIEAHEAAQIPVVDFGSVTEASFDLTDEADRIALHHLKAQATELGIPFTGSATAESLLSAIEEHRRAAELAASSVDGEEGDGGDYENATFDELKEYAKANSIQFSFNIGEDTLRERVKEHVDG